MPGPLKIMDPETTVLTDPLPLWITVFRYSITHPKFQSRFNPIIRPNRISSSVKFRPLWKAYTRHRKLGSSSRPWYFIRVLHCLYTIYVVFRNDNRLNDPPSIVKSIRGCSINAEQPSVYKYWQIDIDVHRIHAIDNIVWNTVRTLKGPFNREAGALLVRDDVVYVSDYRLVSIDGKSAKTDHAGPATAIKKKINK